jgi:uncharacterized membrane protein
MTSLAEGGVKTAPRGRLVWLALALSLTLNTCFLGGLIWSHVASNRQLGFVERVVQAGAGLNLSPSQHQAFQQFTAAVQERTQRLHEGNQPLFRRIWDEIAKPDADPALIGQLLDQATENRRVYQVGITTALTTFLATLSPDQRAQFMDLAHHHPHRPATP